MKHVVGNALLPIARVDDGDNDVGDQVPRDHKDGLEHQQPHDHRVVAVTKAIEEQPPHSRPRKHRLCGKRMPSWRQNEEAQAPPASTAVLVLMTPASVTTPLTRPPSVSMPRAAQFCWTLPPSFISAAATAGAALPGSAVPSLGEKTPPFNARPVACPRSATSRLLPCGSLRRRSSQNHAILAQPDNSASSLLRYNSPQR